MIKSYIRKNQKIVFLSIGIIVIFALSAFYQNTQDNLVPKSKTKEITVNSENPFGSLPLLPNAPGYFSEKIGQFDRNVGETKDVVVDGVYAYLVHENNGGFLIVDITDTEEPILVNHLYESTAITEIAKDGDYVYLANNILMVLDVSNVFNPIEVFSAGPTSSASSMVIVNNYLYISYYNNGFKIFDITDRAYPSEVGSFDNGGDANSVTVEEN